VNFDVPRPLVRLRRATLFWLRQIRPSVRLVCQAVNPQPSDNSTTDADDVRLRFRRAETFCTIWRCDRSVSYDSSVRPPVCLVCPAVKQQPSDNSTTDVDDVQLRFRHAETSAQFWCCNRNTNYDKSVRPADKVSGWYFDDLVLQSRKLLSRNCQRRWYRPCTSATRQVRQSGTLPADRHSSWAPDSSSSFRRRN